MYRMSMGNRVGVAIAQNTMGSLLPPFRIKLTHRLRVNLPEAVGDGSGKVWLSSSFTLGESGLISVGI